MNTISTIQDLEEILPEHIANEIAQSGSNDDIVSYWLQEWNSEANWNISQLREECRGYGVDEDALESMEGVRACALWLASWNKREDRT